MFDCLSRRAGRAAIFLAACGFSAAVSESAHGALAYHTTASNPKALATATSSNVTIRRQQLICDPSVASTQDTGGATAQGRLPDPTFLPIYSFTGFVDWENELGAVIPEANNPVGPPPEGGYVAVIDDRGIVPSNTGGRIYFRGQWSPPAGTFVPPPPVGDVNLATINFVNADPEGTYIPFAKYTLQYTSLTVKETDGSDVVIPEANIDSACVVTQVPEPTALALAGVGALGLLTRRRHPAA